MEGVLLHTNEGRGRTEKIERASRLSLHDWEVQKLEELHNHGRLGILKRASPAPPGGLDRTHHFYYSELIDFDQCIFLQFDGATSPGVAFSCR